MLLNDSDNLWVYYNMLGISTWCNEGNVFIESEEERFSIPPHPRAAIIRMALTVNVINKYVFILYIHPFAVENNITLRSIDNTQNSTGDSNSLLKYILLAWRKQR